MDSTRDACQGDSGGPLVGHFHHQIVPLELFPGKLQDMEDTSIVASIPIHKRNKHSYINDGGVEETTENSSEQIDPNFTRLEEDLIKLKLSTTIKDERNIFEFKKEWKPKEKTHKRLKRSGNPGGNISDIREGIIGDLVKNLKTEITPIGNKQNIKSIPHFNKEHEDTISKNIYQIKDSTSTARKNKSFTIDSSNVSTNLRWLNVHPMLKNRITPNLIAKRSLQNNSLPMEVTRPIRNISRNTISGNEAIVRDVISANNLSKLESIHTNSPNSELDIKDFNSMTKDELHHGLREVLNERGNVPNFKKDVRNRNLRYLNTEVGGPAHIKSSYQAETERLNEDQKTYLYRTFNFHQPAEGELMNKNEKYNKEYRIRSSRMKNFLERISGQLKEKNSKPRNFADNKVNLDTTSLDSNYDTKNIGERKRAEGILATNSFFQRKLSQQQKSRLLDLGDVSKSKAYDSDYINLTNGKETSLGRFLWSMPNNDTKIAVQSMINAGIQASILSALEHFKELQLQQLQANVLQEHNHYNNLANLQSITNNEKGFKKVKFII